MSRMRSLILALLTMAPLAAGPLVQVRLAPVVRTTAVPSDADDPAIWVHPTDPAQSLVIVTNKVAAPAGAVVVYDLDGRVLQTIGGLDRPNNLDLQQGVPWGDGRVDIVVAAERLKSQLRVWRVDVGTRRLVAIGAVPVLAGERDQRAMPMGVGLYLRPRDGALFAVVSPKTGDLEGYLAQYRLSPEGRDGVQGALVRRFGRFSGLSAGPEGSNEIEAVLVDDALGYVYYSDEHAAVRKYHADPEHPDAARELAAFARDRFTGQREGLALYETAAARGYLVVTDQIAGGSTYRLYRREGEPGRPHDHDTLVAEILTEADATDGIDVTSTPLGARFPAGLFVAMHSRDRNFLFFDWRPVREALAR